MWTIGDIKAKGKAALKANYWRCVLASILLSLFVGGTSASSSISTSSATSGSGTNGESQELAEKLTTLSDTDWQAVWVACSTVLIVILIVSILLKIFVFNPIEVGCFSFFKLNINDPSTKLLDAIKGGFTNYTRTFLTLFVRDLFLTLWTMLFVIPGLIKAYSYCMVPFIIKDNPELTATQAITRSREMMNGNKWKAFLLDLSFIGWWLLGSITCGIVNVFWTQPYELSTHAALYLELKNK